MVSAIGLEAAPTLCEFRRQIHEAEDTASRYEVSAYDLELYPNGTLGVKAKAVQGQFLLTDEGLGDLARLTEIPAPYFGDCDPELRALSFNRRLRKKVPAEKPLQIVLREGSVYSVSDRNLLAAPRGPILDSISDSIPKGLVERDLRVIAHRWNGTFDISVIAPSLTCAPRKGDIVAFGVNTSEARDGAIQVQGAAFRCVCSNGAVCRVCDGRQHRLRRPINRPERQRKFLQRITALASEAWRQWTENADGLVRLEQSSLEPDYRAALRSRLRQAPFFLSVNVVNRLLQRLENEVTGHQEGPSLYDLWNAMTYLGTHEGQLSLPHRFRLRIGAGEFTRNKSRFCSYCRQLLIS